MTQENLKLCIDCKYHAKLKGGMHGCRYLFDREQERMSPVDLVTGEPRRIPEPEYSNCYEMRGVLWCRTTAEWFEPK